MFSARYAGVTEISLSPEESAPGGKIMALKNLAPHYEDVTYLMTMSPPH